ncbi:glycosyltransferase family 2 protein [Butyrivibrio sp. VCD2006]|uniref:glycosyltransferase family 2 protein n=1 Tax=Butyrivibrio sp. VCD2006 TaxID=1280664 RepID=UPI000400EE69|nr:glycosyltransferase family A protein [Butyrivibrio sp. VCD2006]
MNSNENADIYVSVIIPSYNSAAFVETGIQSVLAQSANCIEIILVDDGSNDNTEKICAKYIGEKFQYIKIENGGTGHARNVGISKARGKWIAFLDSDDLYLHDVIDDNYVSKLHKYERDGIDIIWTPRLITNFDLTLSVYRENAVRDVKHHMSPLEFWSCLYRKKFLDEHGIRFYEYQRQDIESAFRYLTASNTQNIAVDNNMAFYLMRNNPKSNTHTWNIHVLSNIKMLVFWDLYETTKYDEDKDYLMKTIVRQYVASCILDRNMEDAESKKLINENRILFKQICRKCNNYPYMTYKVMIEIAIQFYKKIKKIGRKRNPNDNKLKYISNTITYEDIKDRLYNITIEVLGE